MGFFQIWKKICRGNLKPLSGLFEILLNISEDRSLYFLFKTHLYLKKVTTLNIAKDQIFFVPCFIISSALGANNIDCKHSVVLKRGNKCKWTLIT